MAPGRVASALGAASQAAEGVRRTPDDSGFDSGTRRHRVKLGGTAWHQLGANPQLRRDGGGPGETPRDQPRKIEGIGRGGSSPPSAPPLKQQTRSNPPSVPCLEVAV